MQHTLVGCRKCSEKVMPGWDPGVERMSVGNIEDIITVMIIKSGGNKMYFIFKKPLGLVQ